MASTMYDTLLGVLLLVFSMIRLVEFMGGSRDGHVMARAIVWFMWTVPLVLTAWMAYNHRRPDVAVLLALSVLALIFVTIYLISGAGSYNLIPPDQNPGNSNGIYTWIRTDGGYHFLPFTFYILLTACLIYLTALSAKDRTYWILAGATAFAFLVASLFIPQVVKNPLGTLGSLSTLVLLGVGVFTILLTPG